MCKEIILPSFFFGVRISKGLIALMKGDRMGMKEGDEVYYRGKYKVRVRKKKGDLYVVESIDSIPLLLGREGKGIIFLATKEDLERRFYSTKAMANELKEAITLLQEALRMTRSKKIKEKIEDSIVKISKVKRILKGV